MTKELTAGEITQLIKAARQVREKAYAPYSGFSVGAAALGEDGHIYTGCNVENVSYGLANCAERTAIFKSVSEGNKKFRAVTVFADTEEFCSPCGACRQVIAEFGKDILVIQVNSRDDYIINTVSELLPRSFNAGSIGKEIIE